MRMNGSSIYWTTCCVRRVFCSDSPETLADMGVRRPQPMEVNYGNKVRWPEGGREGALLLRLFLLLCSGNKGGWRPFSSSPCNFAPLQQNWDVSLGWVTEVYHTIHFFLDCCWLLIYDFLMWTHVAEHQFSAFLCRNGLNLYVQTGVFNKHCHVSN